MEVFLTESNFDYLWGNHNGYDSIGVEYDREILYIKAGFWIVRDHFRSTTPHTYQQIWQGDYKVIDDRYIVRDFTDPGMRLNILQLTQAEYTVSMGAHRHRRNVLVDHAGDASFRYTTLIAVTPAGVELNRDGGRIRIPGMKEWELTCSPGTSIRIGRRREVEGELLIGHAGTEFWLLGARSINGKPLRGAATGSASIYIDSRGKKTSLH